MRTKTETWYEASVRCHQVKTFDGNILTEDDKEVWLGMCDGYHSLGIGTTRRHRFGTPDEIRRDLTRWDGMPWWYRIKDESLRIFKVEQITVEPVINRTEIT